MISNGGKLHFNFATVNMTVSATSHTFRLEQRTIRPLWKAEGKCACILYICRAHTLTQTILFYLAVYLEVWVWGSVQILERKFGDIRDSHLKLLKTLEKKLSPSRSRVPAPLEPQKYKKIGPPGQVKKP